MTNDPLNARANPASDVGASARGPFPNGSSALMAICSDLDETPDGETYFEIMRFLNTTEETSMGPGVGLEVGNTIYFDMPPGHFSYWNASESERGKIRVLIRSGHIDCLHSYGDLAVTRAHAARALEELDRRDCRLRVWVDHAQAVTNLGSDIMFGHGDDPGHAAYHADLTTSYGISYVWRGRVTSVIGQNRPASLSGIANWRHPFSSLKTLAKETAKQMSAHVGMAKYRLQNGNPLARPTRLRDGCKVTEFLRSSPHWGGVSGADNSTGIAEVLSSKVLDTLVKRGGVSILYTHLGKCRSSKHGAPFPPATVAAFRRLAKYHADRKICVTTTARLLDWSTRGESAKATTEWKALAFPDLQ